MDGLSSFRSSRVHVETTSDFGRSFYFFCIKPWYMWGPERLWRLYQVYVDWGAKWGIFNSCADRCMSFAVYFVWRASEWKSTLEMWLQLCNFDKMTTLKVFWIPDVVTLWIFSQDPNNSVDVGFLADLFKLLSECDPWPTAFYVYFSWFWVTREFI